MTMSVLVSSPLTRIVPADHVGLAGQVAGEQQAGADLVLVEIVEQVHPLDACSSL